MDVYNLIKSNVFLNAEEARQILEIWRFKNEKIVFTNGVFDMLHLGHIQYLSQAASLGSKLIIGLNSDSSTKKIKGNDRPINEELSRATLLSAMLFVDIVILFEELTPISLIKFVKPDVLVKGGDYTFETIVGAPFVKGYGGEVVILTFVKGYSSTSILNKIYPTK